MAMKHQAEVKTYRKPVTPGLCLSSGPFYCHPTNSEGASLNARPKPLREQRILCVDDEIVGMQIRGEILKEHGYSVVLCHCPLEALRQDLSGFDLAILDYQMPILNGLELLLHMRALNARFPIVLLTGCLDAIPYQDRVLFARCIDKSSPTPQLLETIAAFLDPDQIPDYDG